MDRRKKVLVGVLIFLFIVMAVRNYRFFKGGTPPPANKEVTTPMVQVGGSGYSAAGVSTPAQERKGTLAPPQATMIKFEPIPVVDTSPLVSQLASGQWGREPFLTPEEIKPVTPEVEEKPREEGISTIINSILISEGEKVASINGKWYTEGELIVGTEYSVANITAEGVWLEKSGERKLIQLNPNTVQIKSRER